MAFTSILSPYFPRYESIERPYDRPLSPTTCQFLDENVFYPSSKPDRFEDVFSSGRCLRCYSKDHEGTRCLDSCNQNKNLPPCQKVFTKSKSFFLQHLLYTHFLVTCDLHNSKQYKLKLYFLQKFDICSILKTCSNFYLQHQFWFLKCLKYIYAILQCTIYASCMH